MTGGCIASLLLQESVNDYDVYLKNTRLAFKLATYYISRMPNASDYRLLIRLTFEDEKWAAKFRKTALYDTIKVPNSNRDDSYAHDEFWEDKVLVAANEVAISPDVDLMGGFRNVTRVEIFVGSSGLAEDPDYSQPDSDDGFHPEDSEDKKYAPVFLSSNAITLTDKMQIVLRFTGKPEEIHETYDFIHATNYWTAKTGVVTNKEALEALLARELIYRGSKYPLASIFRTRKFINRGWGIHMGNYVKMALQLNDFDLTDPRVLEEQLTGVDMAYMKGVIDIVKQKQKQKDMPDFDFNSMWLCEVCDRLMGIGDREVL